MNRVRCSLLVVLAIVVALPATGYATSFSEYQARFLEQAAAEERAERDGPGTRDFTKLAEAARSKGAISIADLPVHWQESVHRFDSGIRFDNSQSILEMESELASLTDAEIAANARAVAEAQVCLFHARHELSERMATYSARKYVSCARDAMSKIRRSPGMEPTAYETAEIIESEPMTMTTTALSPLPPYAEPGKCYAKVCSPPVYRSESMEVLKTEASEKVEITPAKYEWTEEKVMTRPSTVKLEEIPAVYEWVEEKILDTPAHTYWKKEPTDTAGEGVICLVEEPAKYKTIRKRMLKTPATTREIDVPAEYEMVKVQKLVEPSRVTRVPVPAEYETVSRQVLVADGGCDWQEVICNQNMTPESIKALEEKLHELGYNPGPIDGVMDSKTMVAVNEFQKDNDLATGALTIHTVNVLEERHQKIALGE